MRVRYVLATLLALFALLTLFDRFVLLELLLRRTALPLLMAFATAIACIGAGALARRSNVVDAPLDFLLGLPLFGTTCFLAGSLKISPWTMAPLTILGVVAGVLLLLAGWRSSGRTETLPEARSPNAPLPPETFTQEEPVHRWAVLLIVAVLACGFVTAQAPPSSLDELAYHLAVPHTWALEGRVVELPLLSHSYFPMGVESASLPLLTLLNPAEAGVASHFLHLLAAIATTLLIARTSGSWLITAAIVTTPALAVTAGWSLVDWPLTGLFIALYGMLERGDARGASAVTAAGLLTKYTFLPFAILLWALKRRRPQWMVFAGLVFFVRNLLLTGNPVAPFLSSDAPHVSGFRSLALADYVFEGAFIDEALGAAIVALPAFAAGALPIASALAALALFFLAPSSRILVPFLAVSVVSATQALRRRWFAALIAVAVVVQTFLVVWFTARGGAFALLAGGVSEAEYLRRQRPSHVSVEWLDQRLPTSSRTLVVGTGETFWFTHPVRGGGNFDGPRMSRYLDLATPEALRARLRADGITHVALVTTPIPTGDARKLEERQMDLAPAAQRMLASTLDRYAATVVSRGEATLFTLR